MDRAKQYEWSKTPENDDGVALSAMLLSEERGSYAVLASFMSRLGARLAESPDENVRSAYRELANRAETAFAYEAEHGRRSLMRWDHPTNIEWVKNGLISLSESDRRAFEECNGHAKNA